MEGSKDGSVDVSVERRLVGGEVGNNDGRLLNLVGHVDGSTVGFLVGWKDGSEVGFLVGDQDGSKVGAAEGSDVGNEDDISFGAIDGFALGSKEGSEGIKLGVTDGLIDGL